MTRRTLFMRLLGLVGAGAAAEKVLALSGAKKIRGPWDSIHEIVWGRKRTHSEYAVENVRVLYRDGGRWHAFEFNRAMSRHGEALGQKPVCIGDPEMAEFLVLKKGLVQLQPRSPASKVCQIGFCPGDGKWYGWSHRAICGFRPGDYIFDPRDEIAPVTDEWEQAKLAASRFAASVS